MGMAQNQVDSSITDLCLTVYDVTISFCMIEHDDFYDRGGLHGWSHEY